jgi:hypothetical protein
MSDYATQLESARTEYGAAAPEFMLDACAVSRSTAAGDGQGGQTLTYATVSGMSAVPCGYAPSTGQETAIAGSVEARCDYTLTLPVHLSTGTAVDVTAKDRLIVAARGNQPQRTFEVVTVRRKGSALTLKVDARTVS